MSDISKNSDEQKNKLNSKRKKLILNYLDEEFTEKKIKIQESSFNIIKGINDEEMNRN